MTLILESKEKNFKIFTFKDWKENIYNEGKQRKPQSRDMNYRKQLSRNYRTEK